MDTLQWIGIAGAALAGAIAGVLGWHWHLGRTIDALRRRLEKSEQARNGALERSAQAREQIVQLNKAITELRKTHTKLSPEIERRERSQRAEKALADVGADEKTLVVPRDALQVFADTLPFTR
jgi:chromosome segregation ATPase